MSLIRLLSLLSLLISIPSILILIARVRTTNRLWGMFPLTMIGEEKVPHLAPWQQAMALSSLMDYIDTLAILMTLSIYPSPLSFLSLFPSPWPCSCILPQFKDPQMSSCTPKFTVIVCVVLGGCRFIAERPCNWQ